MNRRLAMARACIGGLAPCLALAGLAALASVSLGIRHPVLAASTGTSPTLSVSSQPGHPGSLVLRTNLGDASGHTVVAFFVVTNEFGHPQLVPLGTAKQAPDGFATLTYRPTWGGEEQFVAKLADAPGSHQPVVTTNYLVGASKPGPLYATANPPRPFSSLGHVFAVALLSIVGLVWLTLIVTLVRVARGLPRLATASPETKA